MCAPGHSPLISQLKPAGLLSYVQGTTTKQIVIAEGFERAQVESWLTRIVGERDDRYKRFVKLADQLLS